MGISFSIPLRKRDIDSKAKANDIDMTVNGGKVMQGLFTILFGSLVGLGMLGGEAS